MRAPIFLQLRVSLCLSLDILSARIQDSLYSGELTAMLASRCFTHSELPSPDASGLRGGNGANYKAKPAVEPWSGVHGGASEG